MYQRAHNVSESFEFENSKPQLFFRAPDGRNSFVEFLQAEEATNALKVCAPHQSIMKSLRYFGY